MDWWIKLKSMIQGNAAEETPNRAPVRAAPRLPSEIMALCSTASDAAFTVTIVSLSVTGLKLESSRRIAPQAIIDIRVPVSLNFENRETIEHIGFKARSVWSNKVAGNKHETGVRYLESENEKRDHWIRLVLRTYGMSTGDDRRVHERHTAALPVTVHRADGTVLQGEVKDISAGGMRLWPSGVSLERSERLRIELQRQEGAPFKVGGTVVHTEGEGDAVFHGIAFDPLDDAQSESLDAIVTRLVRLASAPADPNGKPLRPPI